MSGEIDGAKKDGEWEVDAEGEKRDRIRYDCHFHPLSKCKCLVQNGGVLTILVDFLIGSRSTYSVHCL